MNEAVVDPRVFRFGKAGVATGAGCISSPLMGPKIPPVWPILTFIAGPEGDIVQ
jgi:hypothetical protein